MDIGLKTYHCYFDGGTPSISKSSECTVSTSANQSCGAFKKNLSQQKENDNYTIVIDADDTADSEFEQINSNYFSLNKKVINAFKTKKSIDKEALCTEYEKIIADYKKYIENNPDSPSAGIALKISARCL